MSKVHKRILTGNGARPNLKPFHVNFLHDELDKFNRCKHCRKWYIPFKDVGSDDHFCSKKCKAQYRDGDAFYEE